MVTLQSANAALKTMYLDVVANQLNTKVHPFLAQVEKTQQDVVGKLVKKLVPFGVNGGIGAGTESGSLPTVAENNYVVFETTLKNLYGTIELTDKALRASSSDAGAFVNLLSAEMEGLLEASKFNFARMLYGNGTGLVATGVATASGANTMTVNKLNNIMVGQKLDIFVDGTYEQTTRVLACDFANKTITLSTQATADMADSTKTTSLYVQGSKDKELTGLGAIFDSSISSIYGLSKASFEFLKPISKTVSEASFSEASMMEVVDECDEKTGGQINFVCGSFDARQKYQKLLSKSKINCDIANLAGGYKTITFNGIPVLAEKFVDNGTIFFLNSEDFKIHQLGDWQWIENDKGQILRQKEGFPTHTATLVKYAELVCSKPGAQGKLSIS